MKEYVWEVYRVASVSHRTSNMCDQLKRLSVCSRRGRGSLLIVIVSLIGCTVITEVST